MYDCRLIMEKKDGRIQLLAEKMGMVELAEMAGVLEQSIGLAALQAGDSLEDVKDNLLDLHLAAMEVLTQQAIKERSNHDSEEEIPDTEGKETEC